MLAPNIYSFSNYRDYLKSHYHFLKKTDPSFSYQKFAKLGNLNSPNTLKVVSIGSKNLSTITILKFARALNLNFNETLYFEAMVFENQAKEEIEREFYKRKLEIFRPRHLAKSLKLVGSSTLCDHPVLPAALSLLSGQPAGGEVELIVNRLSLAEDLAKNIVSSIRKEKIIIIKDNVNTVNTKHIIFTQKISNQKQKKYLKHQLALSIQSFEKNYEHGAKFLSHSMGVSKNNVEEVFEELKNLISRVNDKYTTEPASEVLQINLQSFLLSRLNSPNPPSSR